jgi:hypothetical protein
MKKILFAVLITVSSLQVFASDPIVNEKVLNAFNKTFQNAKNVSWTSSEFTFEVRFEQNKITSKITYDRNGNITKSLRYYSEEQLPIIVLTKLKTRFPDKSVFGVVEESSEDGTFYHITLEDEKNWLDVKSDIYGSLSIEKKFKKA